jgi:hypothetical protein
LSNYIKVHRGSSLILTTIASSYALQSDDEYRYIVASESTLTKYYKLLKQAKRNGHLVDVGALALVSPHFLDSLVENR